MRLQTPKRSTDKFDECTDDGIPVCYFKGDAYCIFLQDGKTIVESNAVKIFENEKLIVNMERI